jgi:hypothetical protein
MPLWWFICVWKICQANDLSSVYFWYHIKKFECARILIQQLDQKDVWIFTSMFTYKGMCIPHSGFLCVCLLYELILFIYMNIELIQFDDVGTAPTL